MTDGSSRGGQSFYGVGSLLCGVKVRVLFTVLSSFVRSFIVAVVCVNDESSLCAFLAAAAHETMSFMWPPLNWKHAVAFVC